jgi:hypothetical protein
MHKQSVMRLIFLIIVTISIAVQFSIYEFFSFLSYIEHTTK